MKRIRMLFIVAFSLLVVGLAWAAATAAQQTRPEARDVEGVDAAGAHFIAAIAARDIHAMEKLWAHDSAVTFIGPLSTTIVIGWDGVRKAWEMRFGQFDQVRISLAESHIRVNGAMAWAVGVESVHLLRKDSTTLSFDAFVTNVFEKRDGRWLMISHHATPIFRETQQGGSSAE